jgi:hopanoid biosynthesis associated RND transporter like protein HpnN
MASRWEQFGTSLLTRLADTILRHPRWFFYPQLALFAACIWYTAFSPWKLEFDPSRDNLVGGDKKYHQNYLRYKKEFVLPDELVVVVESEDKEKNRQFVERLGNKLEAETNLFMDVVWKGDLKMLGSKALLFVPENDLREMRKTLHDYRPFLREFSRANNLASLFSLVNRQFLNASREENPETTAMIKALPALERIITQASDSLQRQGAPPTPGITALFGGGEEAESQIYVTFAKGRIYLVTTRAVTEDLSEPAVRRLRELVAETQLEVGGLNVGVTGEPILEIDEMAQSTTDTTTATIISLVLVALIFVFGYHETGRPIKATIALVIGLGYTMAFTTAAVGHLNILTVTFAPILVGLAIDFGVHLISRYEEEIRHGRSNEEALRKALVFTGMGVVTGALTTAGAFLAMAATDFRGIQEMGIICGGGLVICLIPMMTILPVMLLRGRQNVIDHALGTKLDRREMIENLWLSRPRRVIAITVAICLAALIPARKVYFDYNLLEMQSKGLASVIFGDKLINSAKKSVLFGAIVADSLEDAVRLEARLTNLPTVASVDLAGIDNMAHYLTEDQSGKLEIVGQIKREMENLQFAPEDNSPANIRELSQALFAFYGYASAALGEVASEESSLRKTLPPGQEAGVTNATTAQIASLAELRVQLQSLRTSIGHLNQQLRITPTNQTAPKLAAFQQALFRDIRDTFTTLRTQDDRGRLSVEDLPGPIRKRFVGTSGKYLVQVYPKKNVWERKNQSDFVAELRSVDPNVTGTPVQLFEYTTLLKTSYQQAALWALLAIAILVWLHFRSFACVFLSLLPVSIGTLWMIGFMGIFEVPFNPANIMTLPLIIGIGVTNGIHILNRFSEEAKPSLLARSTGKAVLVSGLTTIAGFGSLMIAQHRGISSLGFVMAIGTATCMLAGVTVLPAILNLLSERGWTIKKPSGDNAQSSAGSGGTEVKTSTVK